MSYQYSVGPASSNPNSHKPVISSDLTPKNPTGGPVMDVTDGTGTREDATSTWPKHIAWWVVSFFSGFIIIILLAVIAVHARTKNNHTSPMGINSPSGIAVGDDLIKFRDLTRECEVLPEQVMAKILQLAIVESVFHGAICRWEAVGLGPPSMVNFSWFEWGTLAVEKDTNRKLGYRMDVINIGDQGAIRVRIPQMPQSCGVIAAAPLGGVMQWWVHPSAHGVDSCAQAVRLMELSIKNAI